MLPRARDAMAYYAREHHLDAIIYGFSCADFDFGYRRIIILEIDFPTTFRRLAARLTRLIFSREKPLERPIFARRPTKR